ncbi:MAG: DUF3800 domain-containing protein [Candidatus Hydrogenedentota bacterium]
MMRLAYFDETGDDGYPDSSSPLFVLTALYLHYLHWQAIHEKISEFRKALRETCKIPVKTEFHSKPFLLNKKPYRGMNLGDTTRVSIFDSYCDLIASLEVRIVNVVIVKPRILSAKYQILDRALTYVIQRIENDLNPTSNPDAKFLIVSDEGRIGKMRQTTRKLSKIQYIGSKFGPSSYRKDLKSLIEDPLPKRSNESYLIQVADLVSCVVYFHALLGTGIGELPNRLPSIVDAAKITDWMDRLKPALNLKASERDPYGIVYHPQ